MTNKFRSIFLAGSFLNHFWNLISNFIYPTTIKFWFMLVKFEKIIYSFYLTCTRVTRVTRPALESLESLESL